MEVNVNPVIGNVPLVLLLQIDVILVKLVKIEALYLIVNVMKDIMM